MEFLHSKNSQGSKNDQTLPIEFLRVNWYYRPRDIQRKVNDTRVVFASMHSDTCPLTSLRGKCQILHRNDISDLDEYRKTKDCFWYEKMFDRYIHRYYEVIPTSQVINVPARVKKVLDERWKFVIVEMGRGKELTSAIKTCKRCVGYCARSVAEACYREYYLTLLFSNDSVDCAMCKNTYHMNCVRPPLLKKPARGFAWSCGPCSRKQERKLEARNTPHFSERATEGEDEELLDEEDDDHGGLSNSTGGNNSHDPATQNSGPRPATAEQIAQAKLWPYRYLGIHCRVEDALDYDDRIYPRASSRLGPKHQANVHVWHGRPVELVKPADIRKKYIKSGSHKKDAKLTKETIAALEAEKITKEKRPKWVMDEPVGYIRRGEDHPSGASATTAKLQFKMPKVGEISLRGNDLSDYSVNKPDFREQAIDDYIAQAKSLAEFVGVSEHSTNFLDKALELLRSNNYSVEPALQQLKIVNKRKDLKEPELSKEELKRFEEGVLRYGSELRNVSRHVGKSQKYGEIVRFYYMWKKTDAGKRIWGHHEGRKGKKQPKQADSKLVDDVADDIDDSAFDNGKAAARKRGFECKFCASRKSPQWRRAPATAPGTTVASETSSKGGKDKNAYLMVALCQRCAGLWRKYGIQWENIDEVAKKVANGGGRAWKRRIDEELLIELFSANEANAMGVSSAAAAAAASAGVEVPSGLTIQDGPRKKQKTGVENSRSSATPVTVHSEPPPKKKAEKPPEPPLIPDPPRIKILPCAVCYQMEPMGDQHLSCRHCRLTVHRNCYGIAESRSGNKWTCDTCSNDSTSQISTSYECVLCPVTHVEHELMEPPKVSHKKKTDREREKEVLERDMINDAVGMHRRKQIEQGRPVEPREPLKRTAGNNWVHVVCALWNPEIRLGNAKLLDSVEGVPSIPSAKYEQLCKLCKTSKGVCISCHHCAAPFHVSCAQQYGYSLGFDVTPVKSSRKEVANTTTLGGETGIISAVAFCREHSIKSSFHPMHEAVEESSLNALQVFARNFKQADLTMTGTVRKAALIHSSTKAVTHVTGASATHRSSTSTLNSVPSGNSISGPVTRSSRVSPATVTIKSEEVDGDGDRVVHLSETTVTEPSTKECTVCGTDTSPKWHKAIPQIIEAPPPPLADPLLRTDIPEAPGQIFVGDSCGQANGDVIGKSDDSLTRFAAAQPENLSTNHGNNGISKDISSEPLIHTASAPGITTTTEVGLELPIGAVLSPDFLCHKCHLRKLREPTPRRSTSSEPDPVLLDLHDEIIEPGTPPQLAQPIWPPALGMPSHDPYHGWGNQPTPRFNGRPRMSNGVSHSPPAAVPPLQPHFIGPSAQYHAASYGHPQQQQHHEAPLQHLPNGAPSPYPPPRNHPSHMVPTPYPLHHSHPSNTQHTPHPHPPHAIRAHPAPPPPIRSPPMHDQNTQGPHGPPRAAENPFVIPYQSHSPPRQLYQGIYGSPRGNFERPETPPDGLGRGGGWLGADGQMTNGASASPSLRNLLH